MAPTGALGFAFRGFYKAYNETPTIERIPQMDQNEYDQEFADEYRKAYNRGLIEGIVIGSLAAYGAYALARDIWRARKARKSGNEPKIVK